MYNNQEYISANFTTESNLPKSPNYKKTPHKKNKIARKIVAIGLSAVFFGGIAGGSFYGVNNLLESFQTQGGQNSVSSSDLSLSNVSYTSNSSSQSLDVSTIAEQGFSSVVSVTNI